MKKFSIASTILVLALCLNPTNAVPSEKFHLSLSSGISYPIGYLNDECNTGFNITLEFGYDIQENIRLLALIHWAECGWDTVSSNPFVTSLETENFANYSIFLGIKGFIPVSERLALYGQSCVGFCAQNSSDFKVTIREPGPAGGYKITETIIFNKLREGSFPGVMAGLGMEHHLSRRFFLFADGLFVIIFNREQSRPKEWPLLPAEAFKNPPNVAYFPIRIGFGINL